MYSILALSFFGILNLFLGFWLNKKSLQSFNQLFLIITIGLTLSDWNHEYLWFGDLLKTNNLSINFSVIIQLAALLVISFSNGFGYDDQYTQPAEYYALMLFSLVGGILMVTFTHFITFFVGLEILSVAMYVLTGSDKRNLRSNEAALKYFMMGAFATGILLFGIALIYGVTHSFYIESIGNTLANLSPESKPLFLNIGLILLTIGLLFKVSAAPFHFWTPDVYQGAPTIFTMFMSTVVKTVGFAAMYYILKTGFAGLERIWLVPTYYISMLTLIVANFTALYQMNVKRMLAYSSISHAGYMLITIIATQKSTNSSILYYSLAYTLATITAFGVFKIVSEYQTGRTDNPENTQAFTGLAKNNPLLALSFSIALISLAGIPLTAGFWGKFYVFRDLFNKDVLYPVIIGILTSCIGIFYYFKPIITVYTKEKEIEKIELPIIIKLTLILTTFMTILLGLYPSLVKELF